MNFGGNKEVISTFYIKILVIELKGDFLTKIVVATVWFREFKYW